MDILKNKQTKKYDYISRYGRFYLYYNTKDKKYFYGLTSNILPGKNYVAHKVTNIDTLDYLSNKYYGRPDLYWIIADYNNIQDPFINLWEHFDTLKIPSISDIEYVGN